MGKNVDRSTPTIEDTILFSGFRPGYAFATTGGDLLLRDLMIHLRAFGIPAELHGSGEMFDVWSRGPRQLKLNLRASGCVGEFMADRVDYRSRDSYFGECRLFSSYRAQLEFFENGLRQNRWRMVVANYAGADCLAELCMRYGVAICLLVQEWQEPVTFHNAKVFAENGLRLVVPSRYLQNLLKKENGYASTLIYNKIDFARCAISQRARKQYITLLSGSRLKGLETFLDLAERLPMRQFMVVDGWGNWQSITTTDAARIRRMGNVRLLPTQLDMKHIYGQVSILLVPSIWQEVFGRVVVEAQFNGIPVIASKRGGLPEAMGRGGILVKDYQNVNRWVEAVERMLNNPKLRGQRITLGRINAARFATTRRDAALMKLLRPPRTRLPG